MSQAEVESKIEGATIGPTKLKAWFVYTASGKPGWFSCLMVFENGWIPFGHLCSHPNFAPGDLWLGRAERQEILKRMGIEVDCQSVISGEQLHSERPEIFEKNKDESNWKPLSEEYDRISKEIELSQSK